MSISIYVPKSLFPAHTFSFLSLLPRRPLAAWMCLGAMALLPAALHSDPPTVEDDKIVIALHNIRFEIDPELAGRVSSVQIGGEEFIVSEGTTEQRGSTFWPSPQNWPWPPPRALDSQPYTGGINGDSVVLTSNLDNATSLIFRKVYKANEGDTSILIRYTMINGGTSDINVGPWAVTRVPKTGLTYWLKGEGSTPGELPEINGAIWFDWGDPQTTRKIFADAGGGWLAHVNDRGQFLIKTFEDTPESQKAPGENEIEIYTGSNFFELEHQGPYTEIASGDSLIWEVKWFLRDRPDVTVEAGNSELIAIAEAAKSQSSLSLFSRGALKNSDLAGYSLKLGGDKIPRGQLLNVKGQLSSPAPQIMLEIPAAKAVK